MRTLAASSFAASVAVIATEPLWRANTVLRTIPRETAAGSSLLSQLVKLVREEGVAAQWNGVSVSLWLVCNPVIQFFVYEMIKRRVLRGEAGGGGGGAVGESLTATQGFVIGAVSKAIAAITTYVLSLPSPSTTLAVELDYILTPPPRSPTVPTSTGTLCHSPKRVCGSTRTRACSTSCAKS
jgi:hypothetical protein